MRYYSNTATATTLENSGGITPTSTQLILGTTTGYPTQFPFTLRLDPDTPVEEIVTVNSGAGTGGSPYVVSRGSDGTTARSHAQFSVVTHGFSARDLREPQEHMADTWQHARRPQWTRLASLPAFNVAGAWTNFTSAQWPAISFTSPPSGIVKVIISARLVYTGVTSALALGARVSGGLTVAPTDANSLLAESGDTTAASRTLLISGMTPNVASVITPAWWLSGGVGTGTVDITGGLLIVELQP